MIKTLRITVPFRKVGNAIKEIGGSLKTMFFLFFIGLVYITSAHFLEKRVRNIYALNKEIKELRWEYMTLKSSLMQGAKLSSVSGAVGGYADLQSVKLPIKIYLN